MFNRKILLSNIMLLFSIVGFAQNIQSKIEGNTYSIGDTSCVIRSFIFINDTICEYNQDFFVDIDKKYKHTKIICKYKIEGDKIIMNSIEYPDFLSGLDQFYIPNYFEYISKYWIKDSIIYYNTYDKTIKMKNKKLATFVSGSKFFKYWQNRYIDNINIDTMTFINNCIVYSKFIEVLGEDKLGVNVFYYKFVFENKNNPVSIEQKYKILKSEQANEFLIVNGIKDWESIDWAQFKIFGKSVNDNYILNKKYKYLKKIIKKYKVNSTLQNLYFDNIIYNFSVLTEK